MSGMNPAFIAQQLGHSVQMLLSTYARWLNASADWEEMERNSRMSQEWPKRQMRSSQLIDR